MIRSIRALIVDTNEEDFVSTRKILHERCESCRAQWASNYEAALESICARDHDVYLLSHSLGNKSALDLMSEAIARGCTAPIIILTDTDQEELAIEAIRHGASDCLCKTSLSSATLERSIQVGLERKRIEGKLVHDAMHDPLTGLPNRTLFMDRLSTTLRRVGRQQEPRFALLFLDLDRFKIVNDGLGHTAGDQLLVNVARRLKNIIRPGDTVARLGGDEFTILLEDISGLEEVLRITERVEHELTFPYQLGNYEFRTTASIGIALGPCEYEVAADMMRDADVAMYAAKAGSGARFQVFNSIMHKRALETLRLESEMRSAIDREEFAVHYQPIIDLQTGSVNSFEALVRWQHPERGFIPPGEFIEAAEETGQIIPIGNWVLRESCRQMARWLKEVPAKEPLTISVNISARHFAQPGLVRGIVQILNENQLSPDRLRLEITETAVMHDPEMAYRSLSELHRLGVALALDDFGVGHSSLSYLQQYPIDVLKIDRSFINRIDESPKDFDLVRIIVMLGKTLGMRVVAEGIETMPQAMKLREVMCDCGQGYLYSKPVPGHAATEFLRNNRAAKHDLYFPPSSETSWMSAYDGGQFSLAMPVE